MRTKFLDKMPSAMQDCLISDEDLKTEITSCLEKLRETVEVLDFTFFPLGATLSTFDQGLIVFLLENIVCYWGQRINGAMKLLGRYEDTDIWQECIGLRPGFFANKYEDFKKYGVVREDIRRYLDENHPEWRKTV